ncbi:MAG: hypothetical protein JXR73_04880 [Candidatus Omnitrophica bacterium]|nr:hypothetical protein [Candidatus Omnitrophota bacterium]
MNQMNLLWEKWNRNPLFIAAVLCLWGVVCSTAICETVHLKGDSFIVSIDAGAGDWSLYDARADVSWPSTGAASLGAKIGEDNRDVKIKKSPDSLQIWEEGGVRASFRLVDHKQTLQIEFDQKPEEGVSLLRDALAIHAGDKGCVIAPCREGLLIPSNSGKAFSRMFGASDYEGCHMNMLGLLKQEAALIVRWDDAYVFPKLESALKDGNPSEQCLTTEITLRNTANRICLTPLGKGNWNTIADHYRAMAERDGYAVPLRRKIQRNKHVELLEGASNVKLWQCLSRRMNEESTQEEWVKINWTFDEAASVAEHIKNDLDIPRCLFMIGGWGEGGYDVRHPDIMPANSECGGNEALAEAARRVQDLGYVFCLHDNYQDMYRDAESWDPSYIEKRQDGSLVQGGRWMGGRAYMVCAPNQLKLAMRPQNMPAIKRIINPWAYFIDTTYAVGPRECADPDHPIDRNSDIAWKIQLSDKARRIFGIFGSECGREWALAHSDFFEGLVGVSGRYYHQLKPDDLGAQVIPFWEMVYHDCQIMYGKYGYSPAQAGAYVAHHILCARPLHYHSIPNHRYWLEKPAPAPVKDASATFTRSDQGWAEGLHPMDVFLKNTHEILGPLHAATAHQRLNRFVFLTPDKTLQRSVYGYGEDASEIVVNYGAEEILVPSQWGGEVLLPAYGFVIESPGFAAFYAKKWNGIEYADGALFTIQARDGRNLNQSSRIRIFHGFGSPLIAWSNKIYEVPREQEISTE